VPQGGEIVSAKIQFKTDELGTDAANFTIRGEAADNAAQYVGGRTGNIRARVPTTATAQWSPPAWSLIGEAGPNQQTPELASILQQIVNRPGWAQGNAAAFMIDGTGRRTAEAKDGLTPPVLLLQFRLQPGGPANVAPTANAGVNGTVTMPNAANLNGTVSDDGLPTPPGATTTTWSEVSGPGTVTFGNPNAVDTTATFSAAGTYVLRLTANDGALQTTDDVSIQVMPAAANTAPVVNAGPNRTVQMPNAASLDGTVTDDGLPTPPGATTQTWSKVSGPGTVTFGNASAVDTTATFSAAGSYVLRLTANDGALQANDTMSVTVQQSAAVPVTLTMTASPATVTVPNSVTLSGTLRRTSGGQAVGNRPVQIWVQRNGGAAQVLKTVNTAGNGNYTTTDAPTTGSTYWAVHVANAQFGAAESPHRAVAVKPKVTASLSRTTINLGQSAFVRGNVNPGTAGTPVRLQRWNGSQWVLAQSKSLTGSSGNYEFSVSPTTRGAHRFRVMVPAHQGRQSATAPSGSQGLTLTVR
jgi:hypothetical protein